VSTDPQNQCMIHEDPSYAIGKLHGVQAVASSNLVAPTNTYDDPAKPVWSHSVIQFVAAYKSDGREQTNMIAIDPPMAVRLLAEVEPGSIVQLSGSRGFCAFSKADPQQTRVMVSYNEKAGRFELRATLVQVLDFGPDLIAVPDADSLAEGVLLNSELTDELLLLDDSPKILLRLPDGGARLLDLKSGTIESLQCSIPIGVFREWSVGVKTKVGDFLPLINIGPRPLVDVDVADIVEPDQV